MKKSLSLFVIIGILIQAIPVHSCKAAGPDDEVEHIEARSKQPLTIVKANTELIKSWVPLSLGKILSRSGFIHARLKFNSKNAVSMAASELLFPAQKLITLTGVSWVESIEDHIAHERGLMERGFTEGIEDSVRIHAENIGDIVNTAAGASIAATVPVVLLMYGFTGFLNLYGYNEEISGPIKEYFSTVMFGVPIRHVCFVYNNFLITQGYVKSALSVTAISFLTPLLNEYFMSLSPEKPMNGMAYASIGEACLMLTSYTSIFLLNRDFDKFRLFKPRFSLSQLSKIANGGLPIMLKRVFEAASPFIFIQFIIPDDKNILASRSLTGQILTYSALAITMVAKAINITMKRADGDSAQTVGISGLVQAQLVFGSFLLFVYNYSEAILPYYIDTTSPENQLQLAQFRVALPIQLLTHFLSIQSVAIAANLRGSGQLATTMYGDIISTWAIAMPIAFVLVRYMDYGYQGALIGSFAGVVFNNIFLSYKWISSNPGRSVLKKTSEFIFGSKNKPSFLGRARRYFASFFGRREKSD